MQRIHTTEGLIALDALHSTAGVHVLAGRRLGALFLMYSLYRLHRAAPHAEPALVAIEEDDWAGVEGLADELRTRRHPECVPAIETIE